MKLLEFVLYSFAFGLIACGVMLTGLVIAALALPLKRK